MLRVREAAANRVSEPYILNGPMTFRASRRTPSRRPASVVLRWWRCEVPYRRKRHATTFLCLVALIPGCGDDATEPQTGSIQASLAIDGLMTDADGSNPTNITNHASCNTVPDWASGP